MARQYPDLPVLAGTAETHVKGSIVKIRVTLKDPDTLHESVVEAVQQSLLSRGLSLKERAVLQEAAVTELQTPIVIKWMEWGEYLTVEFDTDAGTATVIPNKK